jgi:hypothetical protein
MISDPGQKIGRPRQLYTGPTERDYIYKGQGPIRRPHRCALAARIS